MESSRIFVSGLPGTISEAQFRKHFSEIGQLTDVKLLPDRRIGFVGYDSHEEAQRAVKYFNKSFIRMSRLRVELARPISESRTTQTISTKASVTEVEKVASNDVEESENDDKLKEFLELSRSKKRKRSGYEDSEVLGTDAAGQTTVVSARKQSDDEYQEAPKKEKTKRRRSGSEMSEKDENEPTAIDHSSIQEDRPSEALLDGQSGVSDADWARSRTSRLLGLLDENEDEVAERKDEKMHPNPMIDSEYEKSHSHQTATSIPTPPSDEPNSNHIQPPEIDDDTEKVRTTKRLFVRNLPYGVNPEDLESDWKALFEPYGELEEAHVVRDKKKAGYTKGTAYVQFIDADAAVAALQAIDGQTFHGRILHVLPADAKRDNKLNDFALSKLPHKKQQEILKRREVTSNRFNWNSLYMNQDAVVSSIAGRFGLAKSDVLDPTSSDAAVKQAQAETHILQETKNFFKQNGIDLNAFKKKGTGDTAILVKNIPYGSEDELRKHFEQYGELKRFLMPPSGTIAIIEFYNAEVCDAAYGGSKNRRFKSSVLYLEKAPKDLFDGAKTSALGEDTADNVSKASAKDLQDSNDSHELADNAGRVTLHVKNLNFKTTTTDLEEAFRPLSGFLSATVQRKKDPKRPDEVLSAGYGFLEFRTSQQAQAAIQTMHRYKLDGHELEIKVSRKSTDGAEERRKLDAGKKSAGKGTKIAIKNLPFETSKKDIRQLFSAYGQLRSVRAPRKMNGSLRGYGFAEFTTPKEAESAMDALRDTHLLGRRLVLDFADEEPEDAEAEIAKMQGRIGSQVNKVALQKLTGAGRKKFSTHNEEE